MPFLPGMMLLKTRPPHPEPHLKKTRQRLKKGMKLSQIREMYQCHIFPREMLLNKIMASSLGASFEENETTFEESYEIETSRGDVPMNFPERCF